MKGRRHGVNLDVYLAGHPRERLPREEEQRIGGLPFGNDERWLLVNHNMRFAVKWCFQLYNRNHLVNDFESLLGAGQDAMIEVALKRYEARGTPFVSYASHYLRRNTNREVHRQLCVVKLPELRETNREHLREDAQYQVPFDVLEVHGSHYGTELVGMSYDGGHNSVEEKELHIKLLAEVERLIPRDVERKIIIMAYGLDGNPPMTSTEIRTSLGKYSREGIRKILNRCKKSLAKSKILQGFMN